MAVEDDEEQTPRPHAPPLRIFMCLMDLVLEKEYEAEAPNQVSPILFRDADLMS